MGDFVTIEERLNNPTILPTFKKKFNELWGKDISFQYIDPCWLDSEDSTYDKKSGKMRKYTDREIMELIDGGEFFDLFDDVEGPEHYSCKKCQIKTVGEEHILNKYPNLDNHTEYQIMNYCESCQEEYLKEMT